MNTVFRGQERKRLVRAPQLLPGLGEEGRREEGNGLKE